MQIDGLHILLVEDNLLNLQVLDDMLRSLGHAPLSTSTVAEALEAIRRQSFDLILTDLHMPDAGGAHLLQALRAMDQFHPPVVLVTADLMSEDVRDRLRLGFADVLPKPIRLADLERVITMAEERRRADARSLFSRGDRVRAG